MKRNDLDRFCLVVLLIIVCKIGGIFSKYYDNSEFDLNPFVDPLELSPSLGLNNGKALPNIAPLINNQLVINDNSRAALEDISTATPKRSDVEVSYDVQANQLLEYLNSATSLFSLNNNNNNYINKPLAIVDPNGFPQEIKNKSANNPTNNNSEINEAIRRKFNSILGEINGTYKLNLDADRKGFRLDKSPKQIECFYCADIKSSSECKEMKDLEYYELVNLFCCQCNADM